VTAKWGTSDVTARRRRYIAVVIVGAVHILILEIFIHARGARRGSEEDTAVWSTLFFVPAEVQRPPATKVKPKSPQAVWLRQVQAPAPATVSSITTTPSPTSSAPQSAADWMSELHSAAADVNKDQAGQGSVTDEVPSKPHSLWAPPLHHAGEQYTLKTGELVVWVSDRCFVVSEPPTFGTPNAFAHLALTHTQCTGSPGPRSDLFKDLPEYKKLHPDE
jgi:hypothetical protein